MLETISRNDPSQRYVSQAKEISFETWTEGQRPDPSLTVSEWADANRLLSQKAASEPGRWRTDRTPYLRAIMDALSSSSAITRVVFMKGAQIGATESGLNWIGYVIDQAPGPMLSVAPTVDMAKRYSKQRVAPMIEESPTLRGRVRESRERDSGNTVLAKEFAGGVLVMTGANSAVGLRSMPARYVFLDEVDGYPGDVDGEGDPVALAEARTRTFQRRKIYMVSTPTIAGMSRIAKEFAKSDQRRFFLPCPHCDEFQTLKFSQLKWPKDDPTKATYWCEVCGTEIGEQHKTEMLRRGEWRATAEGDGRTVGFHLSSLYSPVGWMSWVEIAQRWDAAQGDPDLLKEFINTVLGETWEVRGDAPDPQRLLERREASVLRGHIPAQGLLLTGFADVQMRGIWLLITAHAPNREKWAVEALYIDGDTSDPHGPAFEGLRRETLDRQFPDAFGAQRSLDALAVDSGYRSHVVYAWVRNHQRLHALSGREIVLATKGLQGWGRPALGQPRLVDIDLGGRKIKEGAKVWGIGTWPLKGTHYTDLKLERNGTEPYPAGYWHHGEWLDEVYFRQIVAESLQEVKIHGSVATRRWVPHGPNHYLDCCVGNMALAEYLGLSSTTPEQWAALAAFRGLPPELSSIESFTRSPASNAIDPSQAEAAIEARKQLERNDPSHSTRGAWLSSSRKNWLR